MLGNSSQNGRPRWRLLSARAGLSLALVAALAAAAGWKLSRLGRSGGGLLSSITRPAIDEKVTLSILRSESLSFLVTRRTATQIVVDYRESNILGDWRGVLWATVNWRWGVDLKKITEKDIRRQGETIFCRLGEPELLDFGIQPGSEGFMSKSTAVPKVLEIARGGWQRGELEGRLYARSKEFAEKNQLRPSRDEIVRQLNDATAAVKAATGLDIRFE